MADDALSEPKQRLSLLFFAPERSDPTILAAYDLYLAPLINSRRFDITIMAPNGSPFSEAARLKGIRLHPISDFSRTLLQRTPQLWPILTATRRYRFDIALCHQAFGCRGLNQIAHHVIGICHDDQFKGFATADHLIALTSGAADMAEDLFEGAVDMDVMPYPYRCRFEQIMPLPAQDAPLTIGTSGPFMDGDGLGTFIHMAQLLHETCPDVRFVIAGNGPMEHDLKELSDQIAPFIDFAGPLNAYEMADRFDIYVYTPVEAAFALPLCEMMDAGLACLATSTQGAMDILKGGMVAPLVPVSDAFLMAVQLQEMVDDRAIVGRLKKACFERIREEDFDTHQFGDRLLSLLR